jgi:hypothetical protein
MTEPAPVMLIEGVRLWRDEADPHLFFYLPGIPEPQRGPEGRPAVSLILTGDSAILQLGASWGLGPEQTERLRPALAAATPGTDPAAIVLSPAAVAVSEAVLEVADGSGGFSPVATSPGSGYPPFTAVFSSVLAGERRSLAAAALNGTPGSLRVRYRASGRVRVSATARLRGRIAVRPGDERVAPRARLDAALESGAVTVEVDVVDAPPELAAAARDLVLERAANELARSRAARSSSPVELDMQATAAADLAAELEPTADIAHWFSDASTGAGHVLIASGAATAPGTNPNRQP